MNGLSRCRRSLIALSMAVALADCSSTQARSACVYPQLGLVLVDGSVSDCGLLGFPASNRSRRAAQSCAQKALASHAPVRFGSGSTGVDDAYCSVVVRDATGQLWSIEHSYDVSVEPGEKFFVGRCSSVDFPEPAASPLRHFSVAGCAPDKVGFDRVIGSLGLPQ